MANNVVRLDSETRTVIESLSRRIDAVKAVPLSHLSLTTEDQYIDEAIAHVERSLAPCNDRAVSAALALVGEVLNQPVPDDRVLDVYRRILGKLPPDLLKICIERLLMSYKWPRFPSPADFYEQIKSDLEDRQYLLHKLKFHKVRIQRLK